MGLHLNKTPSKNIATSVVSQETLRASKYNHFVQYGESDFYGYNFLYKTLIRIPADAYPKISSFLNKLSQESSVLAGKKNGVRIPKAWIKSLKDTFFIIDEDFDELSLIKHRYFRGLFANDSLSLVILTGMWCNLDCPYCFEFKRRSFITQAVEAALMKWVEDTFRKKRSINISWFGGEPLLRKESISRLSENFQTFCRDIGAQYNAILTTNGVYLDEPFQKSLTGLGIRRVQITLDGDRDDHDKLRRTRNGIGSFDRIFENIVSLCKCDYSGSVLFRINCCDQNFDGIERLLERFPDFVRERTAVYFRWIFPSEAARNCEFSQIQRGSEPFDGLARLYKRAIALGWQTRNPNTFRSTGYCEVDSLDHYAMDPEGNLYLCTHSFRPRESIGSVLKEGKGVRNDWVGNYSKWYAANPFDDKVCINCNILPLCSGGCRRERVRGGRGCIEEKESLDKYVTNIISEELRLRTNQSSVT